MIQWSDIDNEVEEFQSGYRGGFVSIFKKYEGQETDERTAQNKVVYVSISGFARRYGIGETTFKRWVDLEEGTRVESSSRTSNIVERVEKARQEEQVKAQEALAKALAQQELKAAIETQKALEAAEKAKQDALLKAAREQQLAVEAERRTAKREAEEAAKAKLQEIEARLRSEIKAEPPTPEVLAEMAKQALTSSDPDVVNKMAEAYGKHRVEQDAKNKADAQARQAAARAAQAERDAQNAEKRASKEYDDSALKMFMTAHELLVDCAVLLGRKPITFSNVIASGRTQGELLDVIEEAVEISKQVEASIIEATVTGDPVDVR